MVVINISSLSEKVENEDMLIGFCFIILNIGFVWTIFSGMSWQVFGWHSKKEK